MYEFLIATGRADGAATNKTVEMALIYKNGGNEVISDYFKPGNSSNRGDAFENGQMDICSNIKVSKNGTDVDNNEFIGVMVKFYDKDWQLDKIWVTNQKGGRCRYGNVNKFLGTGTNVGTPENPYRITFEAETLVDTEHKETDFIIEVQTAKGDNKGTDDNVFFKLIDDTGYASETSRASLPGDQYEQGETNTIPSFNTIFGALSKNIVKIIIVKVGNDKWVPQYVATISSILGNKNEFSVIDHLPSGEDSLDTNHNWTSVLEKNL